MMPDDPIDLEEKRVRDAVASLRRDDEQRAPTFDVMWRRAQERTAVPRRARTSRVVTVAALLAPAAAAAALVVFGVHASLDSAPPRSAASLASAAPAPSAAPATTVPTRALATDEALLPDVELDFLLRAPRIGEMARLPDFDTDPVSHRPLP